MSPRIRAIQSEIPREGLPLSTLAESPRKNVGMTVAYGPYLWEYAPGNPGCNLWNHVLQHRLVAEHALGRFLVRGEIVHHENRQKRDNSQGNLIVFPDQSAHLSHHRRQEAPCYRPALIEKLRELATDLALTRLDVAVRLGIDQQTVGAMIRLHGIPWQNRQHSALDEQKVREALLGRSTEEAAQVLGVHQQTLRNNFPRLLVMRVSPGSLNARRYEIRSLATRVRGDALGAILGVSPATVKAAIRRWAKEEPDAWSDVLEFQRSRLGMRWSRGRKADARVDGSPSPDEGPQGS